MSKHIAWIIVAVAVVVGLIVFLAQRQTDAPDAQTPQATETASPASSAPPDVEAPGEDADPSIEPPPANDFDEIAEEIAAEFEAGDDLPETEIASLAKVTFLANETLATVDGVAILGSDLTPFASDAVNEERSMSAEMYAFRLNQAIERELTFQAAEYEGVALTEADFGRLDRLQQGRRHDEAVIDSIGDQDAIIAFELRQAEAHLLEKALLEQRGVAPPYVTEAEVESHYLAHLDAYEPLPEGPEARQAAWGRLSLTIRGELAPTLQSAYQDHRQEYFDQLRANADINVLREPEQF